LLIKIYILFFIFIMDEKNYFFVGSLLATGFAVALSSYIVKWMTATKGIRPNYFDNVSFPSGFFGSFFQGYPFIILWVIFTLLVIYGYWKGYNKYNRNMIISFLATTLILNMLVAIAIGSGKPALIIASVVIFFLWTIGQALYTKDPMMSPFLNIYIVWGVYVLIWGLWIAISLRYNTRGDSKKVMPKIEPPKVEAPKAVEPLPPPKLEEIRHSGPMLPLPSTTVSEPRHFDKSYYSDFL